ncbi:hypothetical protein GGI07_001140 [Coemansia sp. Benny D115]|nr:hypothetical protein GGI07_001140 [Coemansia sp. Benny D115]
MRFSIALAIFAAYAAAAPMGALMLRDKAGAIGAYNALLTSADDAALVSNTNQLFQNLNGVADSQKLALTSKQVSDQIKANSKNKVPTSQTVAWVASVMVQYLE